jgi:hypothetical protein
VIVSAKRELEEKRQKIKLRALDTSDPWKVFLMQRALDDFRAMPQKEKDRLTANPKALDPILAEALRYAPANISGMSKVHYEQLMKDALDTEHGEAIAEAHELEHAIELASSAVETGRDEVRLEARVFDPRSWDEMALPYETRVNAPWLKKFTEAGVEVVRKLVPEEGKETFTAPLATPRDIETGVFANNLDAYKKLTGRAA